MRWTRLKQSPVLLWNHFSFLKVWADYFSELERKFWTFEPFGSQNIITRRRIHAFEFSQDFVDTFNLGRPTSTSVRFSFLEFRLAYGIFTRARRTRIRNLAKHGHYSPSKIRIFRIFIGKKFESSHFFSFKIFTLRFFESNGVAFGDQANLI